MSDPGAQTESAKSRPWCWRELRLAAGIILLLPAIWFSRQTMDGLAKRRELHRSFAATPDRGYARLYMESVLQAEMGCDFDFLRKTKA